MCFSSTWYCLSFVVTFHLGFPSILGCGTKPYGPPIVVPYTRMCTDILRSTKPMRYETRRNRPHLPNPDTKSIPILVCRPKTDSRMSANVTRGSILFPGWMKVGHELAYGDPDEIRIPKEACSTSHTPNRIEGS